MILELSQSGRNHPVRANRKILCKQLRRKADARCLPKFSDKQGKTGSIPATPTFG